MEKCDYCGDEFPIDELDANAGGSLVIRCCAECKDNALNGEQAVADRDAEYWLARADRLRDRAKEVSYE